MSWPAEPGGRLDYPSFFRATPEPVVVLDAELVVRECNTAYLALTGRGHGEILGANLEQVLPHGPTRGEAGIRLRRGVTAALETGHSAIVALGDDIDSPVPEDPHARPRFLVATLTPIPKAEVAAGLVLCTVRDLSVELNGADELGSPGTTPPSCPGTSKPGTTRPAPHGRTRRAATQADSPIEKTCENTLRAINDLNWDQVWDHTSALQQLGIAVQQAMLPARVPPRVADTVDIAVRYRPATHARRVGGDWYDVADLGEGRLAVAVGDVVGHGLRAAAVMGQLRSALSALTVADVGPAAALAALDRVARHNPGATASTAVKVVIDPELDLAIYSSAGHLPPLILRHDASVISSTRR